MTLPDSTCPRCGGPARVVVIHKARVRCELLPACCADIHLTKRNKLERKLWVKRSEPG